MAEAPRDQNHIPAVLLESSTVPGAVLTAKGDQVTGRLLVDVASGGTTTVDAGTATGLPAGDPPTVTNAGTTTNAVFNFGIPAGADGATGATGPAPTLNDTSVTSNDIGLGAKVFSVTSATNAWVVGDWLVITETATPANYMTGNITDYTGPSVTVNVVAVGGSGTGITAWTLALSGVKGADGAGTGDVLGPATNTDNYIPQWNGTNTKTLKNGIDPATLLTTSTGLKLDQTTPQTVINGRPTLDQGLVLGLTPTVGAYGGGGKMFWDATWKTPACELEDNVTLQIGQEIMAYVYNGTGSTLNQGEVVYTSGTQSGVASVSLAQGDTDATSQVLGVITSSSILTTEYGYATIRGNVNNVDTSAWNLGDNLYLDASVAGMLTNVKPNTGDYDTRVGRVLIKDASTGRIYVNIIREYKVGSISAGAGVEMFPDDTTITAGGGASTESAYPIKTLSKVPVTTAEDVDSIVTNNNTALYGSYLNTAPIGLTSIAGGVWQFDIWAGVSSATSVTSLGQNVNRVRPGTGTVTTTGAGTTRTAIASSGTPFAVASIDVGGTIDSDSFLETTTGFFRILSRVSDTEITIETLSTYTNQTTVAYSVHKKLFGVTTGQINNVATGPAYAGLQLYPITSVQGAFTVQATDTLASTFFATTNAVANRTVFFSHNGTTRYSHFSTPLVTLHNDLAGLNGGTTNEYYHLTAAQHTLASAIPAVGTAGNVMTSAGGVWTSAAPTGGSGAGNSYAWFIS